MSTDSTVSSNSGSSFLVSSIILLVQGAVGLGVVVAVLLYAYQDKLLYHPTPPGVPVTPDDNPRGSKSPKEWGMPVVDKVLQTKDGCSIHTWLMLQPNSKECATLIYFHGNAGNMGFRLPNADGMFKKSGLNVLMMDYRGFGKSTGIPSEQGLMIDAEVVLKYALQHPSLSGSPIIAFGRSLGGAVAIALAEKFPDDVQAIIVENTFLSISAMVDHIMPLVKFFKPLVLRIRWESEKIIPTLKQPILFISGDSDELVPPAHMKKLYELARASSHRDFYSVLGGQHNDSWHIAGSTYYKRLKEFVEQAFGGKLCKNRQSNDSTSSSSSSSSSSTNDHTDFDANIRIPTMRRDFGIK